MQSISTITVAPLFAHKARSQGDSDYTKQCLALVRYSGHAAFCHLPIGEGRWCAGWGGVGGLQ